MLIKIKNVYELDSLRVVLLTLKILEWVKN